MSHIASDRLGFNPEDLKRFRRAITRSLHGALVTGPTGSGKTTTLYAAISEMNIQEDKRSPLKTRWSINCRASCKSR